MYSIFDSNYVSKYALCYFWYTCALCTITGSYRSLLCISNKPVTIKNRAVVSVLNWQVERN